MTTLEHTAANQEKLVRLHAVWSELLEQVLRRGFYGTAEVQIAVQDGTIQNMRRRTERIER